MTSQFASDAALVPPGERRFLPADSNGAPLNGQVPKTRVVITANGNLPARCPDVIIISGAAPITVSVLAAHMLNLYGRILHVCNDGVNAVQHIIEFPANTIGTATRRVTFDADARASCTLYVDQSGKVMPLALHLAAIS